MSSAIMRSLFFLASVSVSVSQRVRHLNVDHENEDRNGKCTSNPPHPRNGFVTISASGTEADFHCNPGYDLVGKKSTYCRFGKWVKGTPTCKASSCPEPVAPVLGKVAVSEDGAKAIFSCNLGFRIDGNAELACVDGEWECCEPRCVPLVPCVTPRVPANGFVVAVNQGARAQYGCNRGYVIVGPSVRSCNRHGVYSGTRPVCRKACPKIQHPSNGYAVKKSNVVVVYSCAEGYRLVGREVRDCKLGRWQGEEPVCERVR